MSRRRVSWSIASALELVAVAAAVALARGDEQPAVTPRPPAQPTATTEQAAPPEPEPDRVLVLVRRRGGLPASWERRLRRSGAVDAIAEVSRTQWLLRRSATSAGRVVDAPRRG